MCGRCGFYNYYLQTGREIVFQLCVTTRGESLALLPLYLPHSMMNQNKLSIQWNEMRKCPLDRITDSALKEVRTCPWSKWKPHRNGNSSFSVNYVLAKAFCGSFVHAASSCVSNCTWDFEWTSEVITWHLISFGGGQDQGGIAAAERWMTTVC